MTAALLIARIGTVGTDVVLWHCAVLAAVAATLVVPRTPTWVRLWTPLVLLLFLYSELPALIAAAGHRDTMDPLILRWEQSLFGGQPARAWAARMPSAALSEILHVSYLSYYAIIFSVPVALHGRGRLRDLAEAVFVLLLVFIACFVAYLIIPVAGPRYLWSDGAAPDGPVRRLTVWLLEARSSRGTAFPSSHVAVSVAQVVLAVRYFGPRGWWLGLPVAGLAAGAVYGGFHYLVDVIAGAVLGIVASWAGLRWTASRQANAITPAQSAGLASGEGDRANVL